MIRRLAFIARCIDAAFFAAGVAAVALWGWPTTFRGWFWLSSALAPLVSWVVWRLVKTQIDNRRARQVMAYRRQKFGGFVALPRVRDGRRVVVPVERP